MILESEEISKDTLFITKCTLMNKIMQGRQNLLLKVCWMCMMVQGELWFLSCTVANSSQHLLHPAVGILIKPQPTSVGTTDGDRLKMLWLFLWYKMIWSPCSLAKRHDCFVVDLLLGLFFLEYRTAATDSSDLGMYSSEACHKFLPTAEKIINFVFFSQFNAW